MGSAGLVLGYNRNVNPIIHITTQEAFGVLPYDTSESVAGAKVGNCTETTKKNRSARLADVTFSKLRKKVSQKVSTFALVIKKSIKADAGLERVIDEELVVLR